MYLLCSVFYPGGGGGGKRTSCKAVGCFSEQHSDVRLPDFVQATAGGLILKESNTGIQQMHDAVLGLVIAAGADCKVRSLIR